MTSREVSIDERGGGAGESLVRKSKAALIEQRTSVRARSELRRIDLAKPLAPQNGQFEKRLRKQADP